jgi:isopentenyl phosphate kinase
VIFLKLGGSLITDKSRREAAQLPVLRRLANEIAEAIKAKPDTRLLIGHGSGSFGHPPAAQFGIRTGATTKEDWRGFAEVWAAANRLHRLVLDSFTEAGLSIISFPPSANAVTERGELVELAYEPLQRALNAGLIPVVLGDVAFDRAQGATIVSTEQVLVYLAKILRPERILLAGIEEGVFEDYPDRTGLVPELSEISVELRLEGAETTDVTGGMANKVEQALALARSDPESEIRIFSGAISGNVQASLLGYALGTRILAP